VSPYVTSATIATLLFLQLMTSTAPTSELFFMAFGNCLVLGTPHSLGLSNDEISGRFGFAKDVAFI
jgi:hypothetical protein